MNDKITENMNAAEKKNYYCDRHMAKKVFRGQVGAHIETWVKRFPEIYFQITGLDPKVQFPKLFISSNNIDDK